MTEAIRQHEQITNLDEYEAATARCLEITDILSEIIPSGMMTSTHVEMMIEFLNLSQQLIRSNLLSNLTPKIRETREAMLNSIALAFNNSEMASR